MATVFIVITPLRTGRTLEIADTLRFDLSD